MFLQALSKFFKPGWIAHFSYADSQVSIHFYFSARLTLGLDSVLGFETVLLEIFLI